MFFVNFLSELNFWFSLWNIIRLCSVILLLAGACYRAEELRYRAEELRYRAEELRYRHDEVRFSADDLQQCAALLPALLQH